MPESAVEDKEARDQGKADTRALPGQNQVCESVIVIVK